ncbi:MAG: hypothetical protein RRZ65_00040 [Tannerellaceae bacterium]
MAAEYKMERNPNPKREIEKQALHPRLISQGTVGTEEIAQYAQDTSSISSADMKGALAVLAQYTARQLKDGYTVYIEGIGYLTPTLQSRPVMEAKELRSESVHFKNVAFRCDKKLKHNLKVMPIYKESTPKLEDFDIDERRSRLIWYLDRHDYITSTTYRALNHCSKYSAQNDLQYFVGTELLQKIGHRGSTIYQRNIHNPLSTEKFMPEE